MPDRTEPPFVVVIDGGNSKTEVVVLDRASVGLAERARLIGPGSGGGPEAVARVVTALLAEAGVDRLLVGEVSAAVAGLDFAGDEVAYAAALSAAFPNAAVEAVGDVVAVLDAGGGLGDALAIVCGAGLNAVARGPRGLATVPALGWVSGDWGGGHALGREAVRAAARAEDGRGPATELLPLVLAATDTTDAVALARGIRDGVVTMDAVGGLAEVVAEAAADGDAVASELMARAADEALLLAGVVTRGAFGPEAPVPPGTPAVLAGGLFSDPAFLAAVSDGLRERGFDPSPLAFRPVDGLVRALRERAASR